MKLVIITLAIFLTTTLYGQSDLKLGLCGNESRTLTQAKFYSCNKITVSDTNWIIKSFVFSVNVNGSLKEVTGKGNRYNSMMKSLLAKKITKVYLDKIVLYNPESKKKIVKSMVITITH